MNIVYNARHAAHAPQQEFFRGRLVPAVDRPERAAQLWQALQHSGLGTERPLRDHGLAPLERVHSPAYLRFLQGAYAQWQALGGTGEAFPAVWPVRTLRHDIEPRNFSGQLGLYSMDNGTPLTAGAWEAAYWGAQAALSGLDALAGQGAGASAYVLTRPPGHHAGRDFFGGYCFVNHAAVAAQAALDGGAARVAVLDLDYHHGNGTQALFYDRSDVLFVSLHGDPLTEYPFYLGHADERGEGAGLGCNLNLPLAAGTSNADWLVALREALACVSAYAPELLVVSLGLDTSADDPICSFSLGTDEFTAIGRSLAALGLPCLLVQEGGYAVEAVGAHLLAVLGGLARPRQGAVA
ncbi:histone deacetylase family protein [Variovorax terrae]|uniref:Histone deacetylase family protein n=1 Tax=Variovorax terrae TaxID=2923278 RepID=A0A9X1VSQ6_9BURK|nr:histone deacetylase family protein [Variovorax terrae]MCJ0762685.1 histone deacetylase family protein [Variovorax terrae]